MFNPSEVGEYDLTLDVMAKEKNPMHDTNNNNNKEI